MKRQLGVEGFQPNRIKSLDAIGDIAVKAASQSEGQLVVSDRSNDRMSEIVEVLPVAILDAQQLKSHQPVEERRRLARCGRIRVDGL
jgi:hypothetical protein